MCYTFAAGTEPLFDAIATGSNVAVVAVSSAGTLQYATFNPATQAWVGGGASGGFDATMCISFLSNQYNNDVVFATAGATQGIVAYSFPPATWVMSGQWVMDATAISGVNQLTGYREVSNGFVHVAWETSTCIKYATYASGGALTSVWMYHVGLISRIWFYGGKSWALIGYPSGSQGMVTVVQFDDGVITAPHARLLSGETRGFLTYPGYLTAVCPVVGGNHYVAALTKVGAADASNGSFSGHRGVALVDLSFDEAPAPTKELIGSTFVPGAVLRQFDGTSYTEAGWMTAPESPTIVAATGGSLTSAKTYGYQIVWRRTDAQGNVWRSPPSIAKSQLMGASDTKCTLTWLACNLESFDNVNYVSTAEIYRTEGDGTVYYLVHSQPNAPYGQTLTYADIISDAVLAAGEMLYTTGGVLENYAGPPSLALEVYQDRLWAINAEDPSEVWFTQQTRPGLGLSWYPDFKVRVDGAQFIGLAKMDDKLLLFEQNKIYSISGEGPTPTGTGGYPDPQLVTSAAGALSARAITIIPDGLLFQSTHGIFCLSRGLVLDYRGDMIERYNGLTVVDALERPEMNQVRFVCTGGTELVYDWHHKLWYVWLSTIVAAGAVNVAGTLYRSTVAGLAYYENEAVLVDGVDIYSMKIGTSWMQVGGVQGFQRIWAIQVTGEWRGDHSLMAYLYYDFEAGLSDLLSIPAPTAGAPYRPELRPARQKCSSLRVVLSDSPGTGLLRDSFTISGISLVVGVKKGVGHRDPGQRMT